MALTVSIPPSVRRPVSSRARSSLDLRILQPEEHMMDDRRNRGLACCSGATRACGGLGLSGDAGAGQRRSGGNDFSSAVGRHARLPFA